MPSVLQQMVVQMHKLFLYRLLLPLSYRAPLQFRLFVQVQFSIMLPKPLPQTRSLAGVG